MEPTPMVANYLIVFSETAIEKLKLDQKADLRNGLNNACINFRHYSSTTATKSLITLYYGDKAKREELLRKLFKNTYVPILDTNSEQTHHHIPVFNEEEYQALANELLYQYSASNPGVLTVEACPEYENELNALKKVMNQHPVLLFRAVQMCNVVSHIEPVSSRCVDLLASKNTVCQRIGLETMGFNFQHRVLLFPYAKEIGLLLQAMNKSNDNLISPFATWLNQHEGIDSTTNSLELYMPDELPQYLLLNELEKFINADSEIISQLPNSGKLKDCLTLYAGNLNALLEKEEYLKLSSAIVTLLYARRFYREAQEDFSMGDEETYWPLSKSLKILSKANEFYHNVLAAFINSCC